MTDVDGDEQLTPCVQLARRPTYPSAVMSTQGIPSSGEDSYGDSRNEVTRNWGGLFRSLGVDAAASPLRFVDLRHAPKLPYISTSHAYLHLDRTLILALITSLTTYHGCQDTYLDYVPRAPLMYTYADTKAASSITHIQPQRSLTTLSAEHDYLFRDRLHADRLISIRAGP